MRRAPAFAWNDAKQCLEVGIFTREQSSVERHALEFALMWNDSSGAVDATADRIQTLAKKEAGDGHANKGRHTRKSCGGWPLGASPQSSSAICLVFDVVEFKPHAGGHWVNPQAPAVRADKH